MGITNIINNISYMWNKDSNDLHRVLSGINNQLFSLIVKVNKMALDLTALSHEVDRVEQLNASVEILLQTLIDELKVAAGDPVAVQALADRLKVATDKLSSKVATIPEASPSTSVTTG